MLEVFFENTADPEGSYYIKIEGDEIIQACYRETDDDEYKETSLEEIKELFDNGTIDVYDYEEDCDGYTEKEMVYSPWFNDMGEHVDDIEDEDEYSIYSGRSIYTGNVWYSGDAFKNVENYMKKTLEKHLTLS